MVNLNHFDRKVVPHKYLFKAWKNGVSNKHFTLSKKFKKMYQDKKNFPHFWLDSTFCTRVECANLSPWLWVQLVWHEYELKISCHEGAGPEVFGRGEGPALTTDQREKRLAMSPWPAWCWTGPRGTTLPCFFCCRNHSTTDPNAKLVDSVNRHQSSRRRSVLWLREQRQLRLHQSLQEDPLDQVKYKQFLIRHVLPMLLVKDRRGNFVCVHDGAPCRTLNQDSALVRGI